MNKRRLSKKEAAEMLGVSINTLNHWIVEKRAPHYYKIRDHYVFFLEADIRKFMEKSVARKVG